LVMDCSKLNAIDASAARNCFMPLKKLAESFNFNVAYANCKAKIEFLLKAHDAIGENIKIFSTVYEALDYCEVQLLSEPHFDHIVGGSRSRIRAWSQDLGNPATQIAWTLQNLLELEEHEEDIAFLTSYCQAESHVANEEIFTEGERADRFYVILSGEVALSRGVMLSKSRRSRQDLTKMDLENPPQSSQRSSARSLEAKLTTPSIFGYVDFQLNQPRQFRATATTSTNLATFHLNSMDQLLERHPKALCRLQKALLKASALELNNLPSL